MTTLDEEDRREYYRIEDRIALEISPLSAAEALEAELLQDDSPLFNLLSELHLSDFESQHLLRQLSDKDRTLAAFLRRRTSASTCSVQWSRKPCSVKSASHSG